MILLSAVAAGAAASSASASGLALVIGNASYVSFPPVPTCGPSAHEIAAALRRLQYRVFEADDPTAGQMEGAIGDFAAALTQTPDAPAFIYACAYATSLNGRSFLLPVSANISSPTDVLTQGVLTNTLLRLLEQRPGTASVVALDMVDQPDTPGSEKFAPPGTNAPAPGLGIIAVRDTQLGSDPSPLATALVAALTGQTIEAGPLLSTVAGQLAAAKPRATIVALHQPETTLYLAGAPAPRPPPAVTHATTAPAPPAPTPAVPAVQPTATPGGPAVVLPGEGAMTQEQRRKVQSVLAGLGYYSGQVDGVFGPETRAAIRRYQFEIHADMTGTLTGGQATLLVNRGR